jgi:hypothetical protein
MDQSGGRRGRVRRRTSAAVALFVVAWLALGGPAEGSSVTVTATPTRDVHAGDRIVISVRGADAQRELVAAQCVVTQGVAPQDACGPWSAASSSGLGSARIELVARTGRVGSDPRATCPAPDGGRCVLRIVETSRPGVQLLTNALAATPPGDGSQTVQEIDLTLIGPDDTTPPTTAPSSSVPGTEVPPRSPASAPPATPTPTDASIQDTSSTPGSGAVSQTSPSAGDDALAETGPGNLFLLTVLALALLDLGWLALSSGRPVRAVPQPS